jgi:hypothetical protein
LSDAQLVIAREYGFESWPKLKTHVDAVARGDDPCDCRVSYGRGRRQSNGSEPIADEHAVTGAGQYLHCGDARRSGYRGDDAQE